MEIEINLDTSATYKIDHDLLCDDCKDMAADGLLCDACAGKVLRHGELYCVDSISGCRA